MCRGARYPVTSGAGLRTETAGQLRASRVERGSGAPCTRPRSPSRATARATPRTLRAAAHAPALSSPLPRVQDAPVPLQDESERNQDDVAENQQDGRGRDRSLREKEVAQRERDQPCAPEHQVHPGEAERRPLLPRTRRGRLLAAGHGRSYGPGPKLSTQTPALAEITRLGRTQPAPASSRRSSGHPWSPPAVGLRARAASVGAQPRLVSPPSAALRHGAPSTHCGEAASAAAYALAGSTTIRPRPRFTR